MKGRKILVTGASGLVGFALCRELLERGAQVWGLARFRDPRRLRELQNAGVLPVALDLARDPLIKIPADIEIVFHEAAILFEAEDDPAYTLQANAYSIARLMERCRTAQAFVLASTGGVYPPKLEPSRETDPPGPLGTYCLSKYAMEALAIATAERLNLRTAILRYCWPYSPEGGRVSRLAFDIVNHRPIPLSTTQQAHYQPLAMDDCVRLTIAAADKASSPPLIVNMAGPETISLEQLCRRLGALLGKEPRFEKSDAHQPSHLVDLSRLAAEFGTPAIGLDQGLPPVAERAASLAPGSDALVQNEPGFYGF